MPHNDAAPRVLVVDDERAVRESLERALALHGFEVVTAAEGLEALRVIQGDAPPAVIVLDILMPGVDGLQLTRRLRADARQTPILLLTARDQIEHRVEGLETGADDYLVKPFALDELVARLRALLRRAGAGDAEPARRRVADLVVDSATHEVFRGEQRIELTPTEHALLAALIASPRRVLSRRQLLEAVWGSDTAATENTVEVYVGYLRRKLETG
ncbi:MAG: DNA-binding response regulator, partial [Actinobacteria bacterium QS_5_72_10]